MPDAITLRGVDLTYPARQGHLTALENISLSANAGEFLSILGPSGCGKTTILKIVSGLIACTGGTVQVNGARVDGPPPSIGIVFQTAQLMPWRNILDNILVQAEMRGLPVARYREEARALLRMVGLSAFERSLPHQLSGGMQQRVGICRALLHAPDVLLMDEPFGALDAMTRERMMLELQRIWTERRTTVLFITHSLDEAVFLSDRVVVMSARPGRVVGEFEVPMARPRRIKDERTETFTRLSDQIRDCLERGGAMRIEPGARLPA